MNFHRRANSSETHRKPEALLGPEFAPYRRITYVNKEATMRRAYSFIKIGSLLCLSYVVWACGDGITPRPDGQIPNEYQPGQTEFTTTEPNNGNRYYGGVPQTGEDATNGKATEPTTPQGRIADVEEADIYRIDGNRLFYLNTYKGFTIYNFDNPKSPKRLAKLPVYGYPVEMFVTEKTAYVLLRNALYLTKVEDKLQFQRHNVSQLVSIDISDATKPKILQTIDIIGELREGVSRKIENTLYVVSSIPRYYYWSWNDGTNQDQKEQAWVYSFNIADASKLKLVEKLQIFEGGSVDVQDPETQSYYSRNFDSVTISATSNALMVVENWSKWSSVYVNGGTSTTGSGSKSTDGLSGSVGAKPYCGSYTSAQEAVVSVIDISDPQGNIRLHAKFQTSGRLSDQFKQTYLFDDNTQKGIYFGMFARSEWGSTDCQGTQLVKNTLESWDITKGTEPKQLDTLDFGKPNETIRGSVFDSDRRVAFAITAERIDPLYAINFADPVDLKIASSVDGLSGDMSVFRFIEDKKFLIAVGRDTSEACSGFSNPSEGWWSANIAVSIIDVQDVNKIRLVQRKCVAVQNASWIGSEISWNLDQAHKMIGMHSDEDANVITVPVYYWKENQTDGWWWGEYETAVGMMTWDLSAYDPEKSETEQTVLTNFGTIIHPKGEVRRSVVFTHRGTTPEQHARKVLNISDTHLSLVDIQDLTHPVTDAVVEVAPYIGQVLKFGDYLVEEVNPSGYDYSKKQLTEFRIKKVTASASLENTAPVATLAVGQVERVLKYKNHLVLFRRLLTQTQSTKDPYYYEDVWKLQAVIYDLSNPASPKLTSTLDIKNGWLPYYAYYCGVEGYWGGYRFDYWGQTANQWTELESGFVFLSQGWDYQLQTSTNKLMHLNLSDPAKPQLVDYVLESSETWQYFSLIGDPGDSKGFYLVERELLGKETLVDKTVTYEYRNYAQRWVFNGGTLQAQASINLPGWLIKTWKRNDGTRLFLTQDFSYAQVQHDTYTYWQPNFRLHLLRELNAAKPVAELLDTHTFDDLNLTGLVRENDRLFIGARRGNYYSWYGGYEDVVSKGGTTVTPVEPTRAISQGLKGDETTEDFSDHVIVLDLAGNTLEQRYGASIGTYGVQLMGSYSNRLFLNLPGDGLLTVNMSDPANPTAQQFLRTLGYASHVEFFNSTAYIAAGYFGVYQMDVMGTSSF